MIDITKGLISKIVASMVSKFKPYEDEDGNSIKGSTNEYFDNDTTYLIKMTEAQGGKWHDFRDVFIDIYEEYKDEMDFTGKGCYPLEYNGGTATKFMYDSDPYLLFVTTEGSNSERYELSITKLTYRKGK